MPSVISFAPPNTAKAPRTAAPVDAPVEGASFPDAIRAAEAVDPGAPASPGVVSPAAVSPAAVSPAAMAPIASAPAAGTTTMPVTGEAPRTAVPVNVGAARAAVAAPDPGAALVPPAPVESRSGDAESGETSAFGERPTPAVSSRTETFGAATKTGAKTHTLSPEAKSDVPPPATSAAGAPPRSAPLRSDAAPLPIPEADAEPLHGAKQHPDPPRRGPAAPVVSAPDRPAPIEPALAPSVPRPSSRVERGAAPTHGPDASPPEHSGHAERNSRGGELASVRTPHLASDRAPAGPVADTAPPEAADEASSAAKERAPVDAAADRPTPRHSPEKAPAQRDGGSAAPLALSNEVLLPATRPVTLRTGRPAAPEPVEVLLRAAPGLERQLAHKARELLARGHTQIRVTLDPPSLGKLRVELDVSDNRIAARIVATSPDALLLLQRDKDELVRSFQQAGIEDVTVNVESEPRDTARGRDEEDRRGDGTKGAPAPAEASAQQKGRTARGPSARRIDLIA